MTLVSGSQMFYSIENVTFSELCTIIRHRGAVRSENATPTLYFDVSWLARKLSTASNDGVKSIIHLAEKFIVEGIKVVLCFDNISHRHHSKKATVIRNVKAEQARVDCILLRTELMRLFHQLNESSRSDEEKRIIKEKMNTTEKKIHKLEKTVRERLRFVDLYENVTDLARRIILKHPHHLTIVEAKTQADTVICYENVNGDCDAAISNDGDFIMVAGKHMLLVKDFHIDRRGGKLGELGKFWISSSHFSVLKSSWVDLLKKRSPTFLPQKMVSI